MASPLSRGRPCRGRGLSLSLAGAWLLGRDARDVLAHGPEAEKSLGNLQAMLWGEIDPAGALRLVAQMPPGDRERHLSLLTAFCGGLFEPTPSTKWPRLFSPRPGGRTTTP
jgi:hypothetical protein